MEDLIWLDACARRLTELEGEMTVASAGRIAMRIWHTKVPVCYRHGHPVSAAERWYAGATSSPQASYAAAMACEALAAVPTGPEMVAEQALPDVDVALHAARTAWAFALHAAQDASGRIDRWAAPFAPVRLAELAELGDAADAARRGYENSRRASIASARSEGHVVSVH